MMKQEALFKRLGIILEELNDQYSFLSENPEQLSEVEMELFLANANFLTDHIQIIRKLNLPIKFEEVLVKTSVEEVETRIHEFVSPQANLAQGHEAVVLPSVVEIAEEKIDGSTIEPLNLNEGESFRLDTTPEKPFEFILDTGRFDENDKFDFEEKSADELFDRPLTEEESKILAQKVKLKENRQVVQDFSEEDELGPEPFLVQKEELSIKSSVNQHEEIVPQVEPEILPKAPVTIEPAIKEDVAKPTINDLLAAKNNAVRLNDSGSNEVTDLKSAVSLNDKLLYIKDLFNGYNLAYAEAIDIANRMANFDAADNFFQKNYATKNNWADKQGTVDKFYLLLNKRFKD